MTAIIKHPAAHSGRLERWLGKESCENLSKSMRGWYGRPIAVAGVPGKDVAVDAGGDFRGRVYGGAEAGVREAWEEIKARGMRGLREAGDPSKLNAAFTGLSDFIASFSDPSKRRSFPLTKVGASGVANVTSTLWQSTGWPPAGAAGSAAPGGRACDSTTIGAWPYNNAAAGTMKFVSAYIASSVVGHTSLLYDRLFDVAKTMSSSTTESVTGVPTRYQNTTTTADDYAGDNFLFIEIQAALGATAHNWTVCQYTNQAGTAGQTLPSLTGNSSGVLQRLDHPLAQWFAPLATGDKGIKALTQMQCSASVTGSINFVMGHPIAWIPCGSTVGVMAFTDGATTAFARIFDSACLALLEINKPVGTANNYTGTIYASCS